MRTPGQGQKPVKELQGITLRRMIGYERKNREGHTIYIEREILQALPEYCDLNFEVNLALETMLTSEQPPQIQIVKREPVAS